MRADILFDVITSGDNLLMPKPVKKQEPFDKVRVIHRAGVIRVGQDQRGEWAAFWVLLALAVVAAVFALIWAAGPTADGFGRITIGVLFFALVVLPLLWGILWRLAFRYELWLYPDECVAERRWMWHEKRYDGEWIDFSGGVLEITGRRMRVRSNDPDVGSAAAIGCLSVMLGPIGPLLTAALMGTGTKMINKRVPVLAVRRGDESVTGLALFLKNRDARAVIRRWEETAPMDPD